ncbi:MAG: hypothetical protein NT154_01970 [Verrucomicrobia bacterium]|nr:hypothetical protein [Verrucomicrobiota bacterium]
MSNTYSTTAANLSRIGVTALQPVLAPLAKFSTIIPLNDREYPGQPSVISLATGAATVQTGDSINYLTGDSTLGAVTATPTHFAVSFGVSNDEYQIGLLPEFVAPINAKAFGTALWDAVAALLTTTNYGAPVVTVASSAFASSDFDTLLASVPSPDRCAVLDSPWFMRVKPQTWHPPGFNSTFESNRWSAAGEKVHGFCGAPPAIICRWAFPQLIRSGWEVVAREVSVIPGLQLPFETSVFVVTNTRQTRACYSLYFGCGVGDPAALKLLTSVS